MGKPFSIYLDLVRIAAALLVFLSHAADAKAGGARLGLLGHFGHDAVVIFFVLSGIVIAHVATTREHNFGTYMTSRLARLWSVAIPALLLTVAADGIGMAIDPTYYTHDGVGYVLAGILSSLFLVNQIWFVDIIPGSNWPFWSLSFEFWYYLVFGFAVLLPGRAKYAAALLACAIMGPKILLMLPIWLLGVAIYRYRPPGRPLAGLALMIGSLALYALFRAANLSEALNADDEVSYFWGHLGMAGYFLSDYIVAVLLGAHFIGFRMAEPWASRILLRTERPIRFAAGITFSLYLYHLPLMMMLAAILPGQPTLIIAITLAMIVALASVTEGKKDVVRRWLVWTANRIRPARAAGGSLA